MDDSFWWACQDIGFTVQGWEAWHFSPSFEPFSRSTMKKQESSESSACISTLEGSTVVLEAKVVFVKAIHCSYHHFCFLKLNRFQTWKAQTRVVLVFQIVLYLTCCHCRVNFVLFFSTGSAQWSTLKSCKKCLWPFAQSASKISIKRRRNRFEKAWHWR